MARENTPTTVRATGTTERVSSHTAVDNRLGEGFERAVNRRPDWRGAPIRKKSRKR